MSARVNASGKPERGAGKINSDKAQAAGAGSQEPTSKPAIVKKYANRRLYNTATSSYVTLDELCQMVRLGQDFVVYDAKSGEDITRSVLTQIILEEDAKGRNLLPIGFLRRVISFYDDSLHAFLPRYLELSMENFARHQDQMRGYVEQTFGRFFPVNQFEDMARQNMALFQKAATMFTPFADEADPTATAAPDHQTRAKPSSAAPDPSTPATPGDESLGEEMRRLKAHMEALERQLQTIDDRATRPDKPTNG